MRAIHKIIIHCTATREGDDISVDTIRRWHLNRGFSDIGYHYVIDIKGNINAGRPIELIGAHCKGETNIQLGLHMLVVLKRMAKHQKTQEQKHKRMQ